MDSKKKIKQKDMTKEQYNAYIREIRERNKGSKIIITHLDKELVNLIGEYLASKEGK